MRFGNITSSKVGSNGGSGDLLTIGAQREYLREMLDADGVRLFRATSLVVMLSSLAAQIAFPTCQLATMQ